MKLSSKILSLHRAFDRARLPHAFGGALALAWCTQRARGTIDIDVNVFVGPHDTDALLAALPRGVEVPDEAVGQLRGDGQARLWWDGTPVDVFLNTTEHHGAIATRCRTERFAGADVPFLSCADLAVFKAFLDRTKDWADLEEMHAAGTLDADPVVGALVRYLGPDDGRVRRILTLAEPRA